MSMGGAYKYIQVYRVPWPGMMSLPDLWALQQPIKHFYSLFILN